MKKTFLCLGLLTLLLNSCTNKGDYPSHIAFKETKNDRWELMTTEGKIVVENEFKEQPSFVFNDIFFVENTDGEFYMYNINKPTIPVGNKYIDVSIFTDEITPVVKKKEWIKCIDKKGNVKLELPKSIVEASSFEHGYSVTKNEEGFYGAVNMHGAVIIPYIYKGVKIIDKDMAFVSRDDKNYILTISTKKEKETKDYTTDGEYFFYKEEGNIGLKDKKGKIIIRAKYEDLEFLPNDGQKEYLAALNNDGWGILNIKGETIIKHIYKSLVDYKDGIFIASRDWDEGYGLLNMKSERLIKYEYKNLNFLDGTDYLVGQKKNDNTYYVVDKQGNVVNEYSELGNYSLLREGYGKVVKSDYFDFDKFAEYICFAENRSVENLFSFEGKSSQDCAEIMDLALNAGDISDNTWFPERTYTSPYGKLSVELGFNQVMEEYYEGYYTKYRFYNRSYCNKANLKLKLDKEQDSNEIEDAIIAKLKEHGYAESKEDDGIYYNVSSI